MSLVCCIGCGAQFSEFNAPAHRYIRSSSGCWACFRMVTARGASRSLGCPKLHRLTLDAYTVQHPGKATRQNARSIALHLISLYAFFEEAMEVGEVARVIRRAAKQKARFEWLSPPSFKGEMTIADIGRATESQEHTRLVWLWARSAWSAWSEHHPTIRNWLSEMLSGKGGLE